jgi:hypothetical protein
VAIFVAVLPLAIVESRFNDGRSADWRFQTIPASPATAAAPPPTSSSQS